MHKKIAKAVTATLMATTLLSTTVATVVPMSVSAGEILGETTFDYKATPWHTCETNPGKQEFDIDEKCFHVKVLNPGGDTVGGEGRWDVQTRVRNLNFRAGHTYKITWKGKASSSSVKVYTKIGTIDGKNEYWGNNSTDGGSKWDPISLSTDWVTYESEWTPDQNYENLEWAFHYGGAKTKPTPDNEYTHEACSKANDEIWFDNMSIIDTSGSQDDADPLKSYGMMSRDYSGLKDASGNTCNYISVNQVGYYTNLNKVATLGDNAGDILYYNGEKASKIELSNSAYEYEIKDASTGEVKYTGQTNPVGLDADSNDNCHTIDFTEFKEPGEYYIQIKGQEWRSFPFSIGDDIYTNKYGKPNNMLTNALNYFYQNRSGLDIEAQYVSSSGTEGKNWEKLTHIGGHKEDKATVQNAWVQSYSGGATDAEMGGTYGSSEIVASGGWYDAGDHGKYVVNGGISVWTLQNMYERAVVQGNGDKFADGSGTHLCPETGNKTPDILDECAYEMDWMCDMVVKSNEPTWGKYAGLVYHKLHDHKWTGLATRPYDYEKQWGTTRIVKPPTFAATLNFVACAAQASRLIKPYDSARAEKYLTAAKSSYEAFKTIYAKEGTYSKDNPLYAPLDQAIGGGAYGDNEVNDDAYWAACELFATTGDQSYYNDLSGYKDAFIVVDELVGGENKGSFGSFNWGCTSACGSMSLYLSDNTPEADKAKIAASIEKAATKYVNKEGDQAYGIPYEGTEYTDDVNLKPGTKINGYEWGSNSFVINNAIVMAYAYDITQDAKYMNGIVTAMDYLFGRNPLSVSYITGYGEYSTQNPHHRYWSYEQDKTLPMAPDGVMSGGANAGLQDPYVRSLGFRPGDTSIPSQRCYVDSIEAWSTNEVTINWNSPFAWMVSFLQDEAADASDKGLSVSPSSITIKVGETKNITAKVDGKPASDATYKSSDDNVATVSPDGTVTGVGEGTATITVTAGGQTKDITVTVKKDSSTDPTTSTDPTGTTTKPVTTPKPTADVPTETLPSGNIDDLMYGDVNLDGAVTGADTVKLAKYMLSKDSYPLGKGDAETELRAKLQGDVKKDNSLGTADTMRLNEYNLKNITKDVLGTP